MPRNTKNMRTAGFDKNPGNINRKGRPPKLIKDVLSELQKQGYTKASNADIVDAYTTLLQLDEEKIKEIVSDKKKPMFLRVCAKRILAKDGFEIAEKMIDRAHGKALQKSDISSNGETVNVLSLGNGINPENETFN